MKPLGVRILSKIVPWCLDHVVPWVILLVGFMMVVGGLEVCLKFILQ